jgi:pyruvate formate lyase activating enzyme
MLGCDFHCGFCQNWFTSQALRDPLAADSMDTVQRVTPDQLVTIAHRSGARIIASSYNEPLITAEWAVDVFKAAQKAGLRCVFVSNGNATVEALEYLRPYLSAYKVDLKSMQEKRYREMGSVLQHTLDTIQRAHDLGLWVEVVTLVIPGFNDSVDELWEAARFLVSVSPDIPWHVTAFHPDYKMDNVPPTTVKTLQQAAEIGQEAGLHYVYAGNIPGKVGSLEDTHCPACGSRLVARYGYRIQANRITPKGTCPDCGAAIAGIWN